MHDWLSKHGHSENRDEEILGMRLNINATEMSTDLPECMMADDIIHLTLAHDHISMFSTYVMQGWQATVER